MGLHAIAVMFDLWREANRERFKLFEKGGATRR